ncbi:MAG: DUF1549 domain-containing protein [Planctomycetes bacterium]|nr:DUF1549 domain-containing protein [Planctomycetota bacterium]
MRFLKWGEVAVHCRYQIVQSVRLTYSDPKPEYRWPYPPAHNEIDRLMFAKWRQLGLAPAPLCDERTFLRHAYLDLCGLLPTPREAKRFLDDPRPDKRALLIDELLKRDEYADMWAASLGRHARAPLRLPQADHFRGVFAVDTRLCAQHGARRISPRCRARQGRRH